MPLNTRPRLFIGSSSESLPIVEILPLELKEVAEVVPWTDPVFFLPPNISRLVRCGRPLVSTSACFYSNLTT
jgi:hypothetical protein